MATDILADLGHIYLGSRLKRLAERLQADAARIIRECGFAFAPSQFTLLAAIDRNGPLTVNGAVEVLGISQPAVTRSVQGLVELGLVATSRSSADHRHKTITLTAAGSETLARAKSLIWPGVDAAVTGICAGTSGPFLAQVGMVEAALAEASLLDRFHRGLRIVDYSDDLAPKFLSINAEWIDSMFVMEAVDRDVLEHPRERIIDRGGGILFVEMDGAVVGTCALKPSGDGCYELTKMGVLDVARGRKAGEFLLAAAIERARAMRIETLYLLTNTKCAAAIHLYEKAGFVHDAGIMERFGGGYDRCNVAMRLP